jgi:Peptidase family S64
MPRNEHRLVEGSIPKWGDLKSAKKEWAERLIHKPQVEAARRVQVSAMMSARAMTAAVNPDPTENVVGVGIGEKLAGTRPTGTLAVKFLVRMKYPETDLETRTILPKDIDGLPTDVEEVGLFRRLPAAGAARARRHPHLGGPLPNPRTKIRPAQPGCSIGFQDPNNQFVMAGTFGALVKNGTAVCVLSNNHVLADESRLQPGAKIFQPGLLDGGNPATDEIAQLTKFIPLLPQQPNKVDCAIAKLTKPGIAVRDILFIGVPKGVADAAMDMMVHKFGRTTSYTVGHVTSVDTDVTVQYETGTFTFAEQIIIVGQNNIPFSDAGDSGSLILQRGTNKAVGLLFAGSRTHTIANHFSDVLQALNVTLA